MSDMVWSFAQNFYPEFQAKCSETVTLLDNLRSAPTVSPDELQHAAVNLAKLTKNLSDATGSLPSYDQRKCESQLKELEKTLNELRASSSSKPKFSFKRKPAKSTSAGAKVLEIEARASAVTTSNPALTIHSLSSLYITSNDLSRPAISGDQPEVSLSDIDRCIVNLASSTESMPLISAVHVRKLSNSVLLLPNIQGSVMLHELSNCVVVTGCHQFRMHGSTDVDVYLSIPSNPIIEHCSRIRFTSYPKALLSDIDPVISTHFSVQDFSHIRTKTPSPNWRELADGESVSIWPLSKLGDQAQVEKELIKLLPVRESGTVSRQDRD
ncbi:tubulin binding cofactor C-domain-containing protein [Hygrophoropsis aurantiaca]|uniref:Tubulin binding cofactor C-domain-containing protein n=1 Tax=Hygrophoropsis aurantiaca TaxID=72124 RepID=A0ACB8AE08_9AGAM|nr:tubulin binding cofactor C-domain-containing protein [Hygrophoropsis aurantiaca]